MDLLASLHLGDGDAKGQWKWEDEGNLLTCQADSSTRGEVHFPKNLALSYEAGIELQQDGASGALGLVLPLNDNRQVALVIAASGAHSSPYLSLAKVNGFKADSPENPTRAPITQKKQSPSTLFVRVMAKGSGVSITAKIDDRLALRWSGALSALAVDESWTTLLKRKNGLTRPLILITQMDLALLAVQMRSLESPSSNKSTPVPATIPEPVEQENPPRTLATLESLILRYEERIREEAMEPYSGALDGLEEYYKRSLDGLVQKALAAFDQDLRVAAEDELQRTQKTGPLVGETGQELHPEVSRLRLMYQRELQRINRQREAKVSSLLKSQVHDLIQLRDRARDHGLSELESSITRQLEA